MTVERFTREEGRPECRLQKHLPDAGGEATGERPSAIAIPLGRTATRGVCELQEEPVGELEEDEYQSCEPLTTHVIPQESGAKKDAGSSRNSSTNQAAPAPGP